MIRLDLDATGARCSASVERSPIRAISAQARLDSRSARRPEAPPSRGELARSPSWWSLRTLASPGLAWSIVAVGVVLRVAQYLSDRSLWLDESFLALNLLARPYSRLLDTLDFNQGAPPAFLLAEKLAVDAFGSSEEALRLVPLIAGIVSLPLYLYVARRVLAPAAAAGALLLFASVNGLVYYAAELKQYSLDVAVALLLLAVALAVESRPLTVRRALALGGVGAAAVWVSHPAVFMLAGIGTTLLVWALVQRNRRRLGLLALAAGAWLASFAAVYVVTLRELAVKDSFGGAGSEFYLPLPPTSGDEVLRLGRELSPFLTGDLGLQLPVPLAVLAALLGVAGGISLARRSPQRFFLLVAPVGFAAVASALEQYPWGGRFVLFLLPLVPLALLEGARVLAESRLRAGPVLAAVLLGVVAAPSLGSAAYHLVSPRTVEETEPAVRSLGRRFSRGDALYLNHYAQYAFRYYAQHRGAAGRPPPFPVVPGPGGPEGDAPALRSSPPALIVGSESPTRGEVPRRRRVWILLSHLGPEERDLLARLDGMGRLLRAETHPGVVLSLYDLRTSSR